MSGGLEIVPMDLKGANAFVRRVHRHHGPVRGYKFAVALADGDGEVRAVAVVGRPVNPTLDDGWTLEVTRVATDGVRNGCSMLYGAAWRAARALGFRRMVTYTLASESGASLRAAGWRVVGEVKGRSWSTKERPRVDTAATLLDKVRWEA